MIPYLKKRSSSDLQTCPLRSSTTAAGKLYALTRVRNHLLNELEITHFLKSPQAERHLVLPIANAGARPSAYFALARALRGAARSFRAVCNLSKSFHCQGVIKSGSKTTGLPLNCENESP
jgi:hypothetical protein